MQIPLLTELALILRCLVKVDFHNIEQELRRKPSRYDEAD
jgi:hypothetical protein